MRDRSGAGRAAGRATPSWRPRACRSTGGTARERSRTPRPCSPRTRTSRGAASTWRRSSATTPAWPPGWRRIGRGDGAGRAARLERAHAPLLLALPAARPGPLGRVRTRGDGAARRRRRPERGFSPPSTSPRRVRERALRGGGRGPPPGLAPCCSSRCRPERRRDAYHAPEGFDDRALQLVVRVRPPRPLRPDHDAAPKARLDGHGAGAPGCWSTAPTRRREPLGRPRAAPHAGAWRPRRAAGDAAGPRRRPSLPAPRWEGLGRGGRPRPGPRRRARAFARRGSAVELDGVFVFLAACARGEAERAHGLAAADPGLVERVQQHTRTGRGVRRRGQRRRPAGAARPRLRAPPHGAARRRVARARRGRAAARRARRAARGA